VGDSRSFVTLWTPPSALRFIEVPQPKPLQGNLQS